MLSENHDYSQFLTYLRNESECSQIINNHDITFINVIISDNMYHSTHYAKLYKTIHRIYTRNQI